MPSIQNIVALGNSPASAIAIVGGNYSAGALTAAGSTQATALVTSSPNNYFGTVGSGAGGAFPGNLQVGDSVVFHNNGANPLLAYPNPTTGPTEVINALAIATGFSIPVQKSATFYKATATVWMANLSA